MKTKPPDRGKSQATSSINDAAEHLSAADATSVRSPGWLIRHAKLLIGEGEAGEDLQSALLEHTGPLPEGWTIAAALKALEAAIRMGTMARGAIVLPARDAAQRSKELLQEQLVQLLDTGTPLPKALRDEGLAARDLNAARATAQSFSHSH